MNVTEVNSKIVKPNTYEKIIKNLIDAVHQKKAIHIQLETLYLNNIWKFVDLPARRKIIGSK